MGEYSGGIFFNGKAESALYYREKDPKLIKRPCGRLVLSNSLKF
jgi:hypothetical protein